MPYPATPKTWVAGDVLTAAQLNSHLRDALLGAFPLGPPDVAWTAFTPTLTQGVTVTKTVAYAKYSRVGRTIFAQVYLSVTSAGTAGTAVLVGLPVAPAYTANPLECGTGTVFDLSLSQAWKGQAIMNTAPGVNFRASGSSSNVLGAADFTVALASGDGVGYSVTYEAAT